MVSHKKITEILKNWNISDRTIKDSYYDHSGRRIENAYYIGNNHIIKISHDLARIKKQVELCKAMNNIELCTAQIISTIDGEDYVECNDQYYCLLERLQGASINSHELYEDQGLRLVQLIGESIAKLHISLIGIEATVDDINIYENVKDWALPNTRALIGIPDNILESYEHVFGHVYAMLPKQIIHRDLNPGNIIVNGHQCGFIDFELAEKNLRIFDPCYAATSILSETIQENEEEKFRKWIDIYKRIVYGYDRIAKLSSEEWQAIPYLILSIQLICISFFSQQEKYQDILQSNLNMTKLILKYFDDLKF